MPRSLVARSLEPLAASLWGFFLAWTVLLAVAWVGAIDEFWLKANVSNAGLRDALVTLFGSATATWLALGVVNTHFAISQAEGLATARRWLGLLLGLSFVFCVIAVRTGVPLGGLHFTTHFGVNLGMQLLGVPVGWALLWALLVIGAREMVLWMRPRASHGMTALAGGAMVALTFVNLEPLAQRWFWWVWYREKLTIAATVPWHAPLVVCAFAVAFGWLLREMSIVPRTRRRSRKPAIIFFILNALAIVTHLRLWLAPPQSSPMEMLPM